MKFFLDTGNVDEIRRVLPTGLVDGVTTNPTLIAKTKRPFKDVIQEICGLVSGPVSAEAVSLKSDDMIREARELAGWAPNVVIKLPMTEDGLIACRALAQEGIRTNMTLVFNVVQGLMAMKAGATYVSPFVGRLDDTGADGMKLVRDLCAAVNHYGFRTEIIVASVRNIRHVEEAALAGAHIATIPASLFPSLYRHPLTDAGIERFLKDWEQVPKN